jgi:type II secretory pathway pseudopilin PulG
MYLEGQDRERGYALAAVLISVAIMSIVMTALLPVWRQQMQREKEAELAFRGEQYARAIYLFNRKNGGQYPPSIDVLVQGNYLRKKWKDPTNGEEFFPLTLGANQPGPQGGLGGQRGSQPGQRGAGPPGTTGRNNQPNPGLGGQNPGGLQGGAGIQMVVSTNKDASIRIYNGASHYNEWRFLYNGRGRGGPGQQGAPGGGPTQGRPGTGAPSRGGPAPGRGGPAGGRGPGRGGPRGFSPGGRGQ